MEWNHGTKLIHFEWREVKMRSGSYLFPRSRSTMDFTLNLLVVVRIDEYGLPLDKTHFPS